MIRCIQLGGAAALVAFVSACAPIDERRLTVVPGTNGSLIYDGRVPPNCNARDRRVRHFHGDGRTTGHEHLGHGHKWNDRNFKGYLTKPPCYVRRATELRGQAATTPPIQTRPSTAGVTAAAPHALPGDLS